jgi:multidrug resistance efflux pump
MPEERFTPKPRLAEETQDVANEELSERVRALRLPEEIVVGRSSGSWLLRFLCLLLACSTGTLGYLLYQERSKPPVAIEKAPQSKLNNGSKQNAAKTPQSPQTSQSQAVKGSSAVASSGEYALEAKGYIIPRHQILVSPKVNGMVVRLQIIESQRVKKGDVLAELEDTEFRADRERAKALLASAKHNLEELEKGSRPEEIEQARADLAEANAQQKQLQADYKRAAEMLAKKVLSREQYDATESKFLAMERRLQRLKMALKLMEEGPRIERINVARAQVKQAEAELAKTEWRLDNCVIRAPISGTILKKNAEEGSLVNPIAMQGFFSLCEMADLADLEVDLTIQERDISKISVGQKCKIRADAFPDRTYDGYVSRLMPMADRAKGAIPVRVKINVPPNEEGVYLKPEMGALVSFLKVGSKN